MTTPLRALLDTAESPTGWPYVDAAVHDTSVAGLYAVGSYWTRLARRKFMADPAAALAAAPGPGVSL